MNCSDVTKRPTSHIRRIIFNKAKRATCVVWDDGTSTVVHCQKGDRFDKEKAIAMCFMKKWCFDNRSCFNEVFKLLGDEDIIDIPEKVKPDTYDALTPLGEIIDRFKKKKWQWQGLKIVSYYPVILSFYHPDDKKCEHEIRYCLDSKSIIIDGLDISNAYKQNPFIGRCYFLSYDIALFSGITGLDKLYNLNELAMKELWFLVRKYKERRDVDITNIRTLHTLTGQTGIAHE